MSLSPLVREGVRLAREGDFSLLDCMELVDRLRHEEDEAREPAFITRVGGRTLIGYCERVAHRYSSSATECAACGGDGTLSARGDNGKRYEVECPECDGIGDGEFDEDDDHEDSSVDWRDLNGDPAGVIPAGKPHAPIRSQHDARELIAKAKAAIEAPAVEAA